jgi:cytochrome c peroxidase
MEGLPEKPPIPADNPMAPAKIELGKQLYFDKRLSKTGEVSCNSCHNVLGSGTDNAQFSTGIEGKKGGRNSPTVWNAVFHSVQFWDGRAATLEDQAKGPMINPVEMGMENHEAVVKKLSAIPGYKKKFEEVFGANSLNIENVARAIAAYERTLITADSPYDRYLKGNKKALSAKAQKGMNLVQAIGCTACHMGPNFAGPAMPAGQGFYQKFPLIPGSDYEKKYALSDDLGRYQVTKSDADKNMWRIPTWRNVALTAPYFHNGSVKTLDEAVRVMAKTQLGKDLKTQEVEEIVAFLESLTGRMPKQQEPVLPQ